MSLLKYIKQKIFFRQHPEAALRYLPIVELLKSIHLENSKILEVGSGSYGVTPYLKKKIVGLDTLFDEPSFELLQQVNGSGDNLPFKDSEFDTIIMSDVLEHIPSEARQRCLNEAVRVAKKAVIISGPFGKKSFQQDKALAKYSKLRTGKMHRFFKEHLKYGLPEVGDIRNFLKGNQKVSKIQIIGHFFNLAVREQIMKLFILGQDPKSIKEKLIYNFYLKGLMPTVPILKTLNKKPCYRSLALITLKKV